MTIQFGGKQLSTKRLGSTKINKIMLGVTEVFPRVVPPIITSVPGGAPVFTQYQAIVPFSFVSTGGVGPYVYTIIAGALPTGITMTTGGYFSGTPTVGGPFNVTFRTTDSQARYSDQEYTGHVVEAGQAYTPYDLFSPTDTGGWWDSDDIGYTASGLVLGAEANPAPEFDSATGWFVGSNNNITGGQFVAQNGWSSGQSSYANALVFGKTYYVEFEVVEFVGVGSFQVRMGNAPSVDGVITVSKAGVYQAVLTVKDTGAGSRLAIECTSAAGFSMKMNYLRVKEVLGGYAPILFQDSAGGFPVTYIDQPLGLELDKRMGPPTELLSDPNFDTPAEWYETSGTGWSVTGGEAVYANSPAVNSYLNTAVPTMAAGKTYLFKFNVKAATSGYTAMVGGVQMAWLSGVGTKSVVITAGSANQLVTLRSSDCTSLIITDISLKEVSPNYLQMPTAGSRPLWSKRTNQDTYSEDISSAAYRRTGITVAPSPAGTFSDGKQGNLITNDNNTDHRFDCYPTMYGVQSVCNFSFFIKNVDATTVRAAFGPGGSGVDVNLSTMVLTLYGNYSSNGLVEDLGNGEYRISFDTSMQEINSFNFMTVWLDYNVLSSASAHITGLQHTLGYGLEPYQAIGAATDYNPDGFPAFAKYDGIDDNIYNTNQITLSSGAELYACFGVLVAGGAAFGMLAESGVSNADGGFYIGVSGTVLEVRINGAGDTFYYEEFSMAGFVSDKVAIDVVMDRNAVVAQNAIQVSFNGVPQTRTVITNTLSGDGTLFKANPLYIGSRAGNALRFSGRMYNKTILGRKPTTDERINQQNWSMAQMEYSP